MFLRIARTRMIANLFLAIALAAGMAVALHPAGAQAAAPVTKIMPMYNGCAHPEKIPADAIQFAKEHNIALCQRNQGTPDSNIAQPNGTASGDCGWTGITLGSAGGSVVYFNLEVHSYWGGISRLSWQTPYRVDWGPIDNSLSGGAWVWNSDWQYSFTYPTGSGYVWTQLNGWAIVGAAGSLCYFYGPTDQRQIY